MAKEVLWETINSSFINSYDDLVNNNKLGWKDYLDESKEHLKAIRFFVAPNLGTVGRTVSTYSRQQLKDFLRDSDSIYFDDVDLLSKPMDICKINIYQGDGVFSQFSVAFGHIVSVKQRSQEAITLFLNNIQFGRFGDPNLYQKLYGEEGVYQNYADFFMKQVECRTLFNADLVYRPRLETPYNF